MINNFLLWTGADDFRIREKAKFLKRKFKEKYPNGEIEIFEGGNTVQEIKNTCEIPNLFGGKRLIFLEKFWTPETFEQAEKIKLFEAIAQNEETITIITIEPKLDKQQKLSKFLLENTKTEFFEPLNETSLYKWIQEYTQKKNGKISQKNTEYLIKKCGIDLWNLSQEIEKLIALTNGEITTEAIEELSIANPEAIIWDFLENISKKETKKALKLFQELTQSGTTTHEIFPMICREIRIHSILLAGKKQNISLSEIAKEAEIHPFVIQKTLPLSQRFTLEKLTKMYEELFSIDKKIKTGGIQTSTDDTGEMELAIEKFIIKIANKKS